MLSTRGLRYVLSLAVIGMCGGAMGQFMPLHPEGGYLWSHGRGVSDNGIVVGNASTRNDTDYDPWTWTASGGQVFAGIVGAYFGISGDGSTVVGMDYANRFAIRVRNGDVERLSPSSRAWATSGDGSIVGGTSATGTHSQAALWDSDGNRTLLHQEGNELSSDVRSVSRDGSTAMGFGRKNGNRYSIALWNRDGSRRFTQQSDYPWGAVSHDGSVAYAVFGASNPTLHRFVGGSSFEDLGVPFDEVHACSPDGRIVVGSARAPEGWMQAQIYIEGEGSYEFFDWLGMHEVQVGNYAGGFVTGVSVSNGRLMFSGISTEQSAMRFEAFVATVPEPLSFLGVCVGLGVFACRRRGGRGKK